MDDIFKTIPELTEEQMQEINECFTSYVFYKKIKVKRIGPAGVERTVETYDCTCTHCCEAYTHDFEGRPKHNDLVVCPKCKGKAILKHVSFGKKCLTETQRVVLFCPENENKVWLRAFYAYKAYNGDPHHKMLNSMYDKSDEQLTPEIELSETARYLLEPSNVHCWKMEYNYFYAEKCGWQERNPFEPFSTYLGSDNDYCILSGKMIKNTFMKYLDLQAYVDSARDYVSAYVGRYYGRINVNLTKYICEFAKYPIIESLIKAGYGEVVCEKIISKRPNKRLFDWNANKISDFFKGLSKAEIKVVKDEDYQLTFLKSYCKYKKIVKNGSTDKYRADLKTYGYEMLSKILNIVKKHKLSYTKAKNYIGRQDTTIGVTIQLWKDYLDFADQLKLDIKNDVVVFPKHLQKAHDDASNLVSAMIHKEQAVKMKKRTDRLKERYDFEYNGLKIVVPESMQEIITEGKVLCHCVGGYVERHADGKLAILFIRRCSDPCTSFVTMEVQGKKIVQYHGYRNDTQNPLPKQVIEFVGEFKKYIENPTAYRKFNEKEKTA